MGGGFVRVDCRGIGTNVLAENRPDYGHFRILHRDQAQAATTRYFVTYTFTRLSVSAALIFARQAAVDRTRSALRTHWNAVP